MSASALLIASIIRESSPPDAIFAIGRGGSPRLAEMRISAEWLPMEESLQGAKEVSTRREGISSDRLLLDRVGQPDGGVDSGFGQVVG